MFLFPLIILCLVQPDSHHEVITADHGFPLLSQNKHLTLLTPQYYEEWFIDFDQWFQTRRNVLPWFQSSFIESLKSLGKWVKYFKCSLTWSVLPVLMDIRYAFPIYWLSTWVDTDLQTKHRDNRGRVMEFRIDWTLKS